MTNQNIGKHSKRLDKYHANPDKVYTGHKAFLLRGAELLPVFFNSDFTYHAGDNHYKQNRFAMYDLPNKPGIHVFEKTGAARRWCNSESGLIVLPVTFSGKDVMACGEAYTLGSGLSSFFPWNWISNILTVEKINISLKDYDLATAGFRKH